MTMQLHGYPSSGQRETGITTAGKEVTFDPAGCSGWIKIRNAGANDLRVFFTERDFTADINYWTLGTASEEARRYEGPNRLKSIWLKSAAGTTDYEMVVFRVQS